MRMNKSTKSFKKAFPESGISDVEIHCICRGRETKKNQDRKKVKIVRRKRK